MDGSGFEFNGSSTQVVPQAGGINVASVAGLNVASLDVVGTLASLSSGTQAGVLAQWNSSTQSGYELLLDPDTATVELIKVTGGVSSSPLATASVSLLGSNNQLELEANGGTLTAYLNGQFLFTFTDTIGPFRRARRGWSASAAVRPSASSSSMAGDAWKGQPTASKEETAQQHVRNRRRRGRRQHRLPPARCSFSLLAQLIMAFPEFRA